MSISSQEKKCQKLSRYMFSNHLVIFLFNKITYGPWVRISRRTIPSYFFVFLFSLYIFKKKKLDLSKQELEEPQEIQNYPSWIILKQRQGRHLPLGRVSTYPLGDHVGVIQVRRKINKTCNFNIVLTNSNKYVKFTIHKLL